MSHTRKNTRSTKIKRSKDDSLKSIKNDGQNGVTKVNKTNEAHVFIKYSSKLYSDQTGKFPYAARSSNKYLIIIYLVDANVILAEPFKNKISQQLIDTYLKLKKEIDKREFPIDMHVLNNEAPQLYRDAIEKAKSKY